MKKTAAAALLVFVFLCFSASGIYVADPYKAENKNENAELARTVSVLTESGEMTSAAAEKIYGLLSENGHQAAVDYYKIKTDGDGTDFFRIWQKTDCYDVYVIGNNIVKIVDEDGNRIFADAEKEEDIMRLADLKNREALRKITYTVKRGREAEIVLGGFEPGTVCSISVVYASGNRSSASSLEDAVADENGEVSWTWKTGSRTTAGIAEIRVYGDGFSYKYEIEITE